MYFMAKSIPRVFTKKPTTEPKAIAHPDTIPPTITISTSLIRRALPILMSEYFLIIRAIMSVPPELESK